KRAASDDAATLKATTFVFVAARRWNKDAWLAKQRAKGIFAAVHALDVDDLVMWIAAHPTVSTWLAERIGRRPRSGVVALSEAWERWSLCTKPALSERFMLAGRDEAASKVRTWLNAPPSVLTVCADSVDEAAAFLWAAMRDFPDAVR